MPIESLRVTGSPDARLSERVLHLRVGQSPAHVVSPASAKTGQLPVGWEGLIAISAAIELNGSVQTRPIQEAPLVKLQVFIDLGEALDRKSVV